MSTPYYQDEHVTLYHGDCRAIPAWTLADVLITDPPYGMAFASGYRDTPDPIRGDGDTHVRDDALALWDATKAAAVFGTWRQPRPALPIRQIITWARGAVGPGMGDLSFPWGAATEEVYVSGEGWSGKREPNFIVTNEMRGGVAGLAATSGHPTPKPEPLIERIMSKAPPGVVADPFAGSGTTLFVAKSLGRCATGVEIEERHCERIAKRLGQGVLDFGSGSVLP